ncbi:hypothetical protein MMC10_009704 [Thelotrema lepadinum]|nr:hypothetical protein [Thelotrema lepadinum]
MNSIQDRFNSLRQDARISLRKGKKKKGGTEASRSVDVYEKHSSNAIKSLPYEIPNCRLFKLPREIRDNIWEYVLAQNFIHVGNPSTKKVSHIVCRALISDRLAHAMYPYAEVDEAHWNRYRRKLPPGQSEVDYRIKDKRLRHHDFRHSFCFADSWRFAKAINPPYDPKVQEAIREAQLSLTIMRTCRAIYAETLPLVWTYNSFGFAKSDTFFSFMELRTDFQRDSLRHLAIKPESTIQILYQSESWKFCTSFSKWSRALKLLPNLVSVYLTARFDLSWEETEAIWCRGELATPVDARTPIEIVDDLLGKPALVDFRAHVESVEVWHGWTDEGADLASTDGCKELYMDLAELLRRRVLMGNIFQSSGSGSGNGLNLDKQQLEHRKTTWEDWQMGRYPEL